ncbi:helix-turn-helix domain-containing protein, partial [Sphingomonas bacterium]|uniref:helix-turn-helix domain-containing protein n=1 Tax=Sphingomonas bacterium TaxID=1895847 RepID=UPI0015759028
MNLRTIDLNLLVLLQALLEERHVSRAARRVGLSQPAMSNALDRCRQLFGDPLLERRGTAMRLTVRGEALRGALAEVLAQVDALVDRAPPGLDRVERTVTLVVADAFARVAGFGDGSRPSVTPRIAGSLSRKSMIAALRTR